MRSARSVALVFGVSHNTELGDSLRRSTIIATSRQDRTCRVIKQVILIIQGQGCISFPGSPTRRLPVLLYHILLLVLAATHVFNLLPLVATTNATTTKRLVYFSSAFVFFFVFFCGFKKRPLAKQSIRASSARTWVVTAFDNGIVGRCSPHFILLKWTSSGVNPRAALEPRQGNVSRLLNSGGTATVS